jgi:hypothetical protein
MKRFLSLGICVVCLALSIMVGNDRALTARNSDTSVSDPIKILGVKVNQAETQSKDPATAKANWLNGLEVTIKNTSNKVIRYLVIKIEFPGVSSDGKNLEIPIAYGQAPVPNAKPGNPNFFQPGATLNLKVAKSVCERAKKRLLEDGRPLPSTNDLQAGTQVVIFEDKTAWAAGQAHYPDPTDPTRWIAAEEIVRNKLHPEQSLAVSFSKTSYNSSSPVQTCYRTTGFTLQYCCSDFGGGGAENPYYVGSQNFTSDPNGHVQPSTEEACCQEGDCCNYTGIQGCP